MKNNSHNNIDDFILSWICLTQGIVGILTLGFYRPSFEEDYLKYMLFKEINKHKRKK